MKYFVVLILLVVLAGDGRAQITINSDDIIADFFNGTANQAQWYTNDTNGLRSLEILNGANKSWDFTGRSYTLSSSGGPPPLVPYSASMPLATDPDYSTQPTSALIR